MEKDVHIEGQTVRLRPLSEKDLDGAYLGWLNDHETNKYSYRQHTHFTKKDLKEFFSHQKKSAETLVLAIEERKAGKHIGNVALQSISGIDKSAEIAILLGEKEFWGKGIGTECFRLMIAHAFRKMGLHRVYCGTHEKNIGMQKVAESSGMEKEGIRKKAMFANGKFSDVIEYGILKDWNANQPHSNAKPSRLRTTDVLSRGGSTKKPRIVTTIEARMGSTRLPGKSMAKILGRPILGHVVERLKNSKYLDDICVATSISKKDDAIAEYSKEIGVKCFRGSEDDVLGRVVGAAEAANAEIIVEVTGDMAVVDWEEIDRGVDIYLSQPGWDIVTNTRTPAYPQGIDVQIYALDLLRKVAKETQAQDDREHVTLYLYKHPEKFKIFHLMPNPGCYDPKLRLMVDYPEDLEFITKIYERLYKEKKKFLTADIINLLRAEPKLRDIVRKLE